MSKPIWLAVVLALASTGAMADAPATAKAENLHALTQHGITWTFDRDYPTGQFINGDYWVIGPVTVTSISPGFDGTKNGSVINVVPGKQGYDTRVPCYDKSETINVPITVEPNSSLISTIAPPDEAITKDKRVYVKSAAVLSVLDKVPPSDAFRPPYSKGDKTIYRFSQLHQEKLLKLKPPADKPSVAECEKYFQGPWLDHLQSIGGWYQNVKPADFVPPYSRDSTFNIDIATLVLLSDNGNENTDKLLTGMVQLGIDYYYMSLQKSDLWQGGSGQGCGRKWPIIFAGLMLDNQDMQHVKGDFAEDDQTFYYDDPSAPEKDALGNPERGVKGWTGATVLYAHVFDHNVDHEHLPPAEWYKIRVEGCRAESYRRICSTCWVGEALAARLMGAMGSWNHPAFFDFEDRWMTEVFTEDQLKQLEHVQSIKYASGPGGSGFMDQRPLDFRKNVESTNTSGNKFIDEMWQMYRGKSEPFRPLR